MIKNCVVCGMNFDARASTKACSACREKRNKPKMINCIVCNTEFRKTSNQLTCSKEHHEIYEKLWNRDYMKMKRPRTTQLIRTCVVCGAKFEAEKGNQFNCSPNCSAIHSRQVRAEYRKKHPWIRKTERIRICVVCGEKFEALRGPGKTCSEEHSKIYQAQSRKNWEHENQNTPEFRKRKLKNRLAAYWSNPQHHREQGQVRNQKRKIREQQVTDRINLLKLTRDLQGNSDDE